MRKAVPCDVKFCIGSANRGADQGDPEDHPEFFRRLDNRHRGAVALISTQEL
jgi:hypothetical protein